MTEQKDISRDELLRSHRVIANYLTLYAWRRGADSVIVPGSLVKILLNCHKLKERRVKLFCDDVAPWFPYHVYDWDKVMTGPVPGRQRALAYIRLSRLPLQPGVRECDFQLEDGVDMSAPGLAMMLMRFAVGFDAPALIHVV